MAARDRSGRTPFARPHVEVFDLYWNGFLRSSQAPPDPARHLDRHGQRQRQHREGGPRRQAGRAGRRHTRGMDHFQPDHHPVGKGLRAARQPLLGLPGLRDCDPRSPLTRPGRVQRLVDPLKAPGPIGTPHSRQAPGSREADQRGSATVVAGPADGRHSWLGVALAEQVGTDPQEHGGVDQCYTELRPLRPQVRVVLVDGH